MLWTMIGFGILMGAAFPPFSFLFSRPKQGLQLYYVLACMGAGVTVGVACYGVSRWLIFGVINRMSNALRDMSSGECDLTQRLPMARVWCSQLKNCGRSECPEFGKAASCWDSVGSNAPGPIHCPTILTGKLKTCFECPAMQSALCDEIDHLAAWFNAFVAKLSKTVKAVNDNSTPLFSESSDLLATAGKMTGASEQMRAQSNTVAATTEQARANLATVSTAAAQVSDSVNLVVSGIKGLNASIAEISSQCQKEWTIAKQADQGARRAKEIMERLRDSTAQISKVLETIASVADRTNLLALNASIEAASAGEAGKGFAVVANEVKELARQTARATQETSQRIEDMQQNAKDAVRHILEIAAVIEDVSRISQSIAAAVEEQSATVGEFTGSIEQAGQSARSVAGNVREAAEGLGVISAGIAQVSKAALNTATDASASEQSARRFAGRATGLQNTVAHFKV